MPRFIWLVACGILATGCRAGNLTNFGSNLRFTSPDVPTAVSQPDLTDVDVDFGAVGLNATKIVTLQIVSEGGSIDLGALMPLQPDGEFGLPLVPGTSVGAAGIRVISAFTPTALGSRAAVYTLATDAVGQESVRLRLTGEGVPQALVVDPDPIAFGNVELDQIATLPVTITNHGDAPAQLTLSSLGGASPSPFALDALASSSLPAGASVTFGSHFAPVTAGVAAASFEVSSCAGCGALSVPLSGTGVTSLLQATPNPIHFGFVVPGGSSMRSLIVTNTGGQTLRLLSPGPAFAASAEPAGFSFGPPLATTPISYPFALAPGQSAVIPIAFVPPRLGFFPTSLAFSTDDPGAREVTVPIDGYGGGAQIGCVPTTLEFGPAQVGRSVRLPVVCTNTGIDVPNHPEAGLLVTAAGLKTNSPFFAAALGAQASSSAGDGGVLLGAGQNVEIDATYSPNGVESDTGTLDISSNDSQKPTLAIALSGQGVQPGACDVQVTPAQLVFGEVPKGARAERQIELTNASSAYCALTSIALDPSSDPAFVLPDGPVPYALLSYPGDPGGAPASLRIGVAFAPQVSQAAATGKLDFSAGGSPAAPVPLVGSSAPACLQIAPASYDFGRVGFDAPSMKSCVDQKASFSVQNICSHPVVVSALEIDSGLDVLPQFSLLESPPLPLTVVPAGQFAFSAGFAPSAVGPKAGSISITTDEPGTVPYEVSLLGDAETSGTRTDTFTAQQNKVDLVFILDDDDDLTEIAAVAQELPGFLQAANDAHLDYRIAVTSTDICDLTPSDQGSFEPCSHCTAAGSPEATYFTPQTPNAAQTLSDLFLLHGQTACTKQIFGDEFFFGSIEAIFQPSLLASHNAGFLRDDAYLALAIVNGDGEDDQSSLSPQAITDVVRGLKADPGQVSVSYIDDGIAALSQAPRVQTLVLATGGILVDTSTRWVPGFFDLFWATERLGGFSLRTSPDPATLLVEENGVPFAAQSNGATIWTYDSTKNAVVFTPQNVPVPGTAITVGYTIACE